MLVKDTSGQTEGYTLRTTWATFHNQRKSVEGEKTTFFLLLCKDVAGKWSVRGWSSPRSQASSWDRVSERVLGFAQKRIQE